MYTPTNNTNTNGFAWTLDLRRIEALDQSNEELKTGLLNQNKIK